MYADNLWVNCKQMLITSATVILLSSPAATFAAKCPNGCTDKSETECTSSSCNYTCSNNDVKCMWEPDSALSAGGECVPSETADCP
jgi:hypothetical protein